MTDPPLPADAESLAVVLPSWVGDTVMATPVLRALREQRPRARIAAIVRPGLRPLLEGLPWVDAILTASMKGLAGPFRLGRCLRASGAGPVLLLPNSFRAGLGARLSGLAPRLGYLRDGRRLLLTDGLDPTRADRPTPTVAYYARLGAWALGVERLDESIELRVTAAEEAEADRILGDAPSSFALLNPGANRDDKRWPAERFGAVAAQLFARYGLACVINGSPAESHLAEDVGAAAGRDTPTINLAERGVTLGSLKAVTARAQVMITNDTGPRHVAMALGTPVVALFGPTDHRWTRYGRGEHALLAEPFLPDELVADRHARLCRIDRIATGDVIAAVEGLLGAPAARPGAAPRAGS